MSEKRKRTKVRSVRFTPEEWEMVQERSREARTTMGRYLRESGLANGKRVRSTSIEDDLIYQLSRIGNNLNQLAHRANAGNFPSHAEIKSALDKVMKAIEGLV